MFSQKRFISTIAVLGLVFAVSAGIGFFGNVAMAEEDGFTTDFRLQDCSFSTYGRNPYFKLLPEYQLLLEGEEDGEAVRLLITVLEETKVINTKMPGVGRVRTRIVEEREWKSENGGEYELVEVSRNYFARCKQTNAIYYFGEDVDIFEDGGVSHAGAWRAGKGNPPAKPGLIMPGTFVLGSRYFQEIALGVAMDQAEHVEMGLSVETSAGTFADCVEVVETTPLEPDAESTKIYCPGVGLVDDDGVLQLVRFGFDFADVGDDDDDDD